MNSKTISEQQLRGMFDHTNLKAFATEADFRSLCKEAADGHFAMVAINSSPVRLCSELLKGRDVHVGAAISFPLGQTTVQTKVYEAVDAIENGADEIDYVINIGELKNGNFGYIRREMERMVEACHTRGAICKVIFENCYLTKEEIASVAKIAREVRPDFVKTSTGFGTSGADAGDIRLMKRAVGEDVQVKAAGGIRSWQTCAEMIDAGASRIGTSGGLSILEEFRVARMIEAQQ